MQNDAVKYRYITVWRDEIYPDVVYGTYAPKLDIDIEIAKELIANRIDFSHGKAVYTLIDFTNVKSVTKEARDFMNSAEGGLKGILGGAFCSNNVVATIFINLYLKVNNPVIPAKFFTDKDEALKWLLKVRSENLQAA